MQKILSLLILSILVLINFGTVAFPLNDTNYNIKWKINSNNQTLFDDEVDQAQPLMDGSEPVGPSPLVSGAPNYILAQSFIPTKNILTKIELMIAKNSTTIYDFTVTIRDNLSGEDLTSTSIPAENVTTENFSWKEFVFPDIHVIPGNTYYIVSSTVNATDNWYSWGLNSNGSTYANGTIYYSIDDEVTWFEEPSSDMTFKTYGITNKPPNPPIIIGPHYGKMSIAEYVFTLDTITDPEGDQIYCFWDWGDGNTSGWVGPSNSGETIQASHTWTEAGNYTIIVKLKDIYGNEIISEPFIIQIVQIKTTFFFGTFENKTETDDLWIVQSLFFIAFPTEEILYRGRTILFSKESFIYFGARYVLGGGNIAIL
jgi:hypothetical protein